MINYSLEELQQRLEEVIVQVDNLEDDYEEKTIELENHVNEELQFLYDGYNRDLPEKESNKLDKTVREYEEIVKKIKQLKKENDFYDAESELDRMFPNRHDDDFDEDSMTYDSVFGND
jgi:hypothetical protein